MALRPAVPLALGDTADVRAEWVVDASLKPRTAYAVVVDRALRDGFCQSLTGNPVAAVSRTPDSIDLFIVGNDGRVYTSRWESGEEYSGVNNNWRPLAPR